MEDRVSQEVAATGELCGDRVVRWRPQLFERGSGDLGLGLRSECSPYCLDHGRRSGLIATDADAGLRAGADLAQVDRVRRGVFENFGLARAHLDCDGVEERSLLHLPTERRQSLDQSPGGAMDLMRNAPETVRAVIDRIHRRDHRRENLRGADVGGRLLTADMLLARLQREPVSWLAAGIDRNAHDATWKRALIGVLGRD